ncbi:MAG TPA: hypothetical protein VFQ26_03530 [Nitrospiraceae bacterium]|nr:hypothetical protein [Nitrospiraceae bacterium]
MALKSRRVASIPVPSANIPSLLATCDALKSTLEVMVGSVGPKEQRAVTFVDLVNMGLIQEDQIPEKFGEAPSGKVLDG